MLANLLFLTLLLFVGFVSLVKEITKWGYLREGAGGKVSGLGGGSDRGLEGGIMICAPNQILLLR